MILLTRTFSQRIRRRDNFKGLITDEYGRQTFIDRDSLFIK